LDTDGYKERQVLQGHEDAVSCVAFSPDGHTLVSGSYDQSVRFWDAGSGTQRNAIEDLAAPISCLAFAPDGRSVAAGAGRVEKPFFEVLDIKGEVFLCDTAEPRVRAKIAAHPSAVFSLAISGDSQLLATAGSGSSEVKLWDLTTGKQTASLAGHGPSTHCVSFSPNGTMLASGGISDCSVHLWDLATRSRMHVRQGHEASLTSIGVTPDGCTLVTAGWDGTARIFDILSGKQQGDAINAGHVHALAALTADGKTLAVRSGLERVRLFSVSDRELTATIEANGPESVYTLAVSADSRLLAIGGGRKSLKVWDIATAQSCRDIAAPEEAGIAIIGLAFSPDGRVVASISDPRHDVNLWEVASGRQIAMIGGEQEPPYPVASGSVAYRPDGRTLAITRFANRTRFGVELWDNEGNRRRAHLQTSPAQSWATVFSPDGQLLACSTGDRVQVWDPRSGDLRREILLSAKAKGSYFSSAMAFTPDGRHLITANRNGTVYVLRVTTYQGRAAK
jgi:WD40 repeat protein